MADNWDGLNSHRHHILSFERRTMKMSPAVRWLIVTFFLLVLSASASAAQYSRSHKPRAHKSHPSHPMRNNRPKHHAMETTRTPLLAVRYVQPQQSNSVVAANSSGSA